MTKIVYDAQTLQVMTLFETLTHAEVKDCILTEGHALFVVREGSAGRAIGTAGRNVRMLEKALKRKVKIVEFDSDVTVFVKNLFQPLRVTQVIHNDGIITVVPTDSVTRGHMIGREATTLRATEDIVKRYFPLKEIKIARW